ncbi:MAG: sigma-54-dependent Fis family transcriptional regulator [Labilithrix sp.]|nr:sigma-54-dependent Fis family transcriptional regulator [Labilithrix sp.]
MASGFVATSEAMQQALDVLGRVAPSSCTVLVTGESGTGKEVVVRALHEMSPLRNGPLVAVNCGAIADNLVESELFGHARGAFTGAMTARRGYVAAAEGGTLFLDEVGELTPAAQVKLLRLLQQREYTPIGETKPVRCNVRVVAATNRDLQAEVRAGRFREDLYFRLDVVHVHLPPLRDRKEEVRPLALHFLRLAAERTGRTDVTGFGPGVLELLEGDDWPGNVRALENTVERAVLLAAGTEIDVSDLPARLLARAAAAAPALPMSPRAPAPSEGRFSLPPSAGDGMVDLRAAVDALESRLIRSALEKSKNNKQRAADLLGIKRTTLIDMMKRKGLAA